MDIKGELLPVLTAGSQHRIVMITGHYSKGFKKFLNHRFGDQLSMVKSAESAVKTKVMQKVNATEICDLQQKNLK